MTENSLGRIGHCRRKVNYDINEINLLVSNSLSAATAEAYIFTVCVEESCFNEII